MRQVGIDTNILLRLLVDDDPDQREIVQRFGAKLNVEVNGHVTLVALIETDWALRRQYGFDRKRSVAAIRKVIGIRGLYVECPDIVLVALAAVDDRNVDFADALIAFRSQNLGADRTVTLDRKAAQRLPEMELLA